MAASLRNRLLMALTPFARDFDFARLGPGSVQCACGQWAMFRSERERLQWQNTHPCPFRV